MSEFKVKEIVPVMTFDEFHDAQPEFPLAFTTEDGGGTAARTLALPDKVWRGKDVEDATFKFRMDLKENYGKFLRGEKW